MKQLSKVFLTGARAQLRHSARPEFCQDTKEGRCGLETLRGVGLAVAKSAVILQFSKRNFLHNSSWKQQLQALALVHVKSISAPALRWEDEIGQRFSHGHVELYAAFCGMCLERARSQRLFTRTTALAMWSLGKAPATRPDAHNRQPSNTVLFPEFLNVRTMCVCVCVFPSSVTQRRAE